MIILPSKYLLNFTKKVFNAMGSPDSYAQIAAECLNAADLRGIDSHGIARLSGYVRLWENKRLNANPKIRTERETLSTAVLNGDSGAGLITASKAMDLAIKKAKATGSGWVGIKNSNHFGIAAFHAMRALKNDMIGIAMTNASPLVFPTFGKERLLGTNPIAVAIPTKDQPPFVVDMATTTVANGKLEVLQRKKENAPYGWVQDKEGKPSKDAYILHKGGSMLPLGGYKGYCLGALVDIFSGVLTGANYGPWVPPFVSYVEPSKKNTGEGIGHFVGAIRIDAFRPVEEFKKNMDYWIQTFRDSKSINPTKRVVIPNDPEREFTERRKKAGIPLQDKVVEDLITLSKKFNLDFSF